MKLKIDSKKCAYILGTCMCGENYTNACCDCGCEPTIGNSECECNGQGCTEVCPVGAITREDSVIIDEKKCNQCGKCVEVCPYGALYFQ